MSSCGFALVNTEMKDFKRGDLLSFWGECVFLVISTCRTKGHYVELDLLNLMNGERKTYEQGEIWYLGKVTL